jgi:hypothetical protein
MLATGRGPLPTHAPVHQYIDVPQPFTDEDWRESRSIRETVDLIAMSMRWKVRVKLLDDKSVREFFFCGEYAEVLTRARVLFRKFESISCEPAGAGIEICDTRLSLVTARG